MGYIVNSRTAEAKTLCLFFPPQKSQPDFSASVNSIPETRELREKEETLLLKYEAL